MFFLRGILRLPVSRRLRGTIICAFRNIIKGITLNRMRRTGCVADTVEIRDALSIR
jgi:hypothetical protein